MSDVISETSDPILSAIQSSVDDAFGPTDEQSEAAEAVEAPAEAEAPAVEAAAEKPAVEDEDAAIKAIEAELVAKTPAMQRGRIGVSRHQAVLTRNRNKWDEEKKTLEAKIKDFETKVSDPQMQRKLQMIALAETDHTKFFQALKALPQYQALIKADLEAMGKPSAPADVAKAAAKVPAEAPGPDVLLADGRTTYSPEQMQEVAKWITSSLTEKFSGELEKVRGEVKPIVDGERHKAALSEATDRMKGKIAEASEKWPGFKEHAAQIGEYIRRPEHIAAGMSLEQAYIAVVPGNLAKQQAVVKATADKEAVEKLQQRVPKSSIRPGATPVVKADESDGKTDMTAIIRAAMKAANLAA